MAESLSYQRPVYLETLSPPPFKRFIFYCVFPATAGIVLLIALHRNPIFVPIRWFALLLIAQAVLMPTFVAYLNSTTRVDSDGLRLTLRIFGIPVYRKLVRSDRIFSLLLVANAGDVKSLNGKYGVIFSPQIMVMMFWSTGVDIQLKGGGRILVGSKTP